MSYLARHPEQGMRPLIAHCHLGLGQLYRRTGKRELMTALTVQLNPSAPPRLLQPELHAYLAVHRRRGGEVLVRLLGHASAPVEPAEAEAAAGDEGAHALFRVTRQISH